MKYFYLFIICLSISHVEAQSSPGNVTTNLELWLKADSGVTGTGPVTAWANQTGSTSDAIQIGDAPDLLTEQVNFNPAINFNGTNDYLQVNGGLLGTGTYTDVWVYSVSKANSLNNSTLLYETTSNGRLAILNPWGGNSYIFTGGGSYNTPTGSNTFEYNMWTHGSSTGTNTPSGMRKSIAKDGVFLGSGSTNNTFLTGNGSDLLIGGGWSNGLGTSSNANTKLAEMIVYTSAPSSLEQERIQSYLAVKYGITKNSADNASTLEDESDYFASDGTTVIWDYSQNTSYHNDVTGIGRDDATELDQRKSKSINNLSLVTIDKGVAFATDKDYLLWGNNAATGTSTAVMGYDVRSDRIWKVAQNGTPGAVSFSIDLSGIGFDLANSTASDFALLIDSDGDFTSGALAHNIGATLNDGMLSFTNVSFANGDFFSIAGPAISQAPGNVTTNLGLWLKADSGVTGTGPVTAWANQTGSTPDAIQIGDAPDLLAEQVNFNPAIDFNGNNDYLQINGGLLGTGTYTEVWIYSVSKANSLNNSTLIYETTLNGNLAILNPWGGNSYIFTGGGSYNTSTGSNTFEYNMWTHTSSTGTNTPSGMRKSISKDGVFLGSGSNNNTFLTGNGSNLLIGAGWSNGLGNSSNANSKVAEMIVYTSAPSPLEQERIQSYLAVKYGITKNSANNTGTPEDEADYFASDGTVIWDYSQNTSYHNDVTGIGRDDATELAQQKSKSINNLSLVTIDKGSSFTTDKDYLLWGNNASTGTSTAVTGYDVRSDRIWKVAQNGTPGTVSFSIDLGGIGFDLANSTASDFALLIDGDGDFNSGALAHTTGVMLNDGILSFTNVSFANGDYFSIAGPSISHAPGNVTTDLGLWLKADAGVTGTGPVTAWTNQTGSTPDAIQIGDAPDLLAEQVNFNPAINFNGTNDYLQVNGGLLGTGTYTSVWVYSVSKANSLNNSTLLYETTSNGRLAILNPWGGNSYIFTGGGSYNTATGSNTFEYNMWTHGSSTGTNTPSGMRKSIAKDGVFLGSGSTNNTFLTGNGSDLLIGGGWSNGLGTSSNANTKLAEMIVYTSAPSSLEQERIQSYLAVKYGITKNSANNTGTPEDEADYFASDGTVTWDYSQNTSYHNDVTGIGRDDATELDQRKSKSINNLSIVTIDKGSSFATDKDYILWGNNSATGVRPYTGGGVYVTYTNKVWKTTITGAPGNINLAIDISGLGFNLPNGSASDFTLLIDTDDDFSSGAIEHTTGVTLVGSILSFTDVDFTVNTNMFFALAKTQTINAVPDDFSANSFLPGVLTPTLYTNDTLDEASFVVADVDASIISDGGLTGVVINTDGTLSIPPTATVGLYTITYQICVAGSIPCDTAVVLIYVDFDTDGDGVLNRSDLDDDNDGILDIEEINCFGNLNYEFYDVAPSGFTVNNIPTTGFTTSGTVSDFDVDALYAAVTPGDGETFSIRYQGYISLPASGNYTFYTRSDDGSKLFIDGIQVVNNDGLHGMRERSGVINLTAGIHNIEVLFFERTGGEGLEVSYASSSISKQFIPFTSLAPLTCAFDEDYDNDNVPNQLDLDADNDGIYDIVESSNGGLDLDNDGIIDLSNGSVGINGIYDSIETVVDSGIIALLYQTEDTDNDGAKDFIDLDSDGDACNDVQEAGFSQSLSLIGELLGTAYDTTNGLVIGNTDGYTVPNDLNTNSIFDFQEVKNVTIITEPSDVTICTGCARTLEVIASEADVYQWQLFDGIQWNDISDNTIYNGTSSVVLTITRPPLALNNSSYRVMLSSAANSCVILFSSTAVLTVNVGTIITNRRITIRVNKD